MARKKCVYFAVFFMFLFMRGASLGVTDSCRTIVAENNGLMGPSGNMAELPGPAILFSDPVVVPAFQLRFVDEESGKPIVPLKITISYSWKWLQYPYPEHSWGAWSVASDIVECFEPNTEISVPEFTVNPRGWYDGKYTKFPFSKKPSFTGIHIAFNIANNNYFPYAEISPKEVKKLKDKTVIVKVKRYGKCDIVIK